MFKSTKRLLTAATVILAVGTPSAAYAKFVEYGPPAGDQTRGQAQPLIAQPPTAAQLHKLDQLQASEERRFASEGGLPTAASTVHPTGPSSQAGFQWGDAGIGAAGVLALVGVGAGATLVIRRRAHQPVAS
jgi:hypothetical protein